MANRYLATHCIFTGVKKVLYGAARRNLGMVC
jgi:hypothetical protein